MSKESNSCEKLTKRDFELLQRVFKAEIENRLPAQIGGSKAVALLQERGYIEPLTRTLSGPFPVTIHGWVLTHAGRFIYCQNCTRPEFNR
jgi:hypothetical protein